MPNSDVPNSDVPVIEVSGLSVRYGTQTAVDAVDLEVAAGETVALLGPNGAGKTSTLEVIQGYRAPDGGSVRVFGHDPLVDRDSLAPRWGVMPQSGGLPMGLTVAECVHLFAKLSHGPQAAGLADGLVETCGLSKVTDRPWRNLSGGEQQRLSLAVALCGGNDLLILDEPTAAVDAQGRERVLSLLAERAEAGSAVLITTHRFEDIETTADRVIIMHRGQIVADGSIPSLTEGLDLISFVATPGLPVFELSSAVGFPAAETKPGCYEVTAPATTAAVEAVTSWLAARDLVASEMRAGTQTLESVFAALTADGGFDE